MSHFKAKSNVISNQVLTPIDVDFSVGLLNYDPDAELEAYHVIRHNEPSQRGEIELSTLDLSMAKNWMAFTYAFENVNLKRDFMSPEMLQTSLAATLDLMPALSGRIVMDGGSPYDLFAPLGRMWLKLNNAGAWFCSRRLDFKFSEMRVHLGKHIVPSECLFNAFMEAAILARGGHADVPLLAAKAIYFPCGSVMLTAHISHLVADGRSMYEFVKLWGQVAMRETPSPLDDCRHFGTAKQLLDEGRAKEVEAKLRALTPYVPTSDNVKPCSFSVHKNTLATLKAQINGSLPELEWVSSNDIVCAMINRMVLRARKLPRGARFSAGRTVDLRSRLGLDADSFGNFVGIHMEELSVGFVLDQTLGQTAQTLRRSLASYTTEKVDHLIRTYSSIKRDAIPFQLAGSDCKVDFIVTSLNRFLPNLINFDDSPGLYFSGSYYLEGGLTLNPTYNSYLQGVAVVAEEHVDALVNDFEANRFGFKVVPMPFKLFTPTS
ncbi:hypothetical protein L0F63_004026 [Massospora cicadina]|nr:hypothetical protein L0F63_004026 [Massospora cicadina]